MLLMIDAIEESNNAENENKNLRKKVLKLEEDNKNNVNNRE